MLVYQGNPYVVGGAQRSKASNISFWRAHIVAVARALSSSSS